MNKSRKPRKITMATFSQSIFLTMKYFMKNRLLSFAGSCSFSFIFSFIPILLMIFTILIKILHTSDTLIEDTAAYIPQMINLVDAKEILASVDKMGTFSFFTVFLGLMILWMARRFMASIMDGMQNIFHVRQKRKDTFAFAMAFIVSIMIVIAVSTLIFLYISLQTLFHLNAFSQSFGIFKFLNDFFAAEYTVIFPLLVILIILTIIYRIGPGTNPSIWLSIFASLLCTLTFWGFSSVIHYLLVTDSYIIIYGGLGTLILTLMDIFFFFTFFMFYAQFIFTYQFFDELLIGELYLLPKKNIKGIGATIRRSLFIKPDFLLAQDNFISYKAGDMIYEANSKSNCAYYIVKGRISLENSNREKRNFSRGDFFGEVGCVIGKPRESNALVLHDADIVKVDGKKFQFLVQMNQDVARKALGQISKYFSALYERKDGLF